MDDRVLVANTWPGLGRHSLAASVSGTGFHPPSAWPDRRNVDASDAGGFARGEINLGQSVPGRPSEVKAMIETDSCICGNELPAAGPRICAFCSDEVAASCNQEEATR